MAKELDTLSDKQTAKLIVEILYGLEHVANPDKIINGICCFLSLYYINSNYSLNDIIEKILEHKTTMGMFIDVDKGEA